MSKQVGLYSTDPTLGNQLVGTLEVASDFPSSPSYLSITDGPLAGIWAAQVEGYGSAWYLRVNPTETFTGAQVQPPAPSTP